MNIDKIVLKKLIKEKRQLFVTVGNNDDTAKMKVNNRREFIL